VHLVLGQVVRALFVDVPLSQPCTVEVTGKSLHTPSVFAAMLAVPATGPLIEEALLQVAVAGFHAAFAASACIATVFDPVVNVWS